MTKRIVNAEARGLCDHNHRCRGRTDEWKRMVTRFPICSMWLCSALGDQAYSISADVMPDEQFCISSGRRLNGSESADGNPDYEFATSLLRIDSYFNSCRMAASLHSGAADFVAPGARSTPSVMDCKFESGRIRFQKETSIDDS